MPMLILLLIGRRPGHSGYMDIIKDNTLMDYELVSTRRDHADG
jgi:hypothetical protein